jgi:hypothetical protein
MLRWGYTMRQVLLDIDSGEGYHSTSVRHDSGGAEKQGPAAYLTSVLMS